MTPHWLRLRSDTGRRLDAPLTIGIVLSPRFTLSALANFVDVLRLAADEGDRSRPIRCKWSILAAEIRPIQSSSGIAVQPQETFGDPARFDYIAVVGGLIHETVRSDPQNETFLRRAAEAGVPLVGLCTGTFVLYRAGLMNGYRGCVSWFHHEDFLSQFDGLEPVSNQIFVVDRDRLTCAGGTSTAHLAAFLVERHVGRIQASKSLHIMMISEAARGETPQPGLALDFKTSDPIVHKTLLLMQQNLDTPLSIKQISARLKVDKRRLERRFKDSIGCAPLAAFREMRLLYVCHLLENTDKSIASIAVGSGFCDSSHLSRMFRKRYTTTPMEFRKALPTAKGTTSPAS